MRTKLFVATCTAAAAMVTVAGPASAAPQTTMRQDGIFVVGVDIFPGIWVTTGPWDDYMGCSWERLSGFSGEYEDVIASDYTHSARIVVAIKPTDVAFKTEWCGNWVMQPSPAPSTGSFGS
ncbi:hypothetical protein [Antrihabitans sp. YC2-6]|uniref:hypothetical protein n=1 Tax=Antrihabitans sp. YC2-6 TaxID=2799498 RepID=UPI0018F62F97|nr:hypothetical protein [Antrihabitans sp. YC2-6]MBJ8343821.1 hypothetical protein [Antrihabitans sp. YC2-6]